MSGVLLASLLAPLLSWFLWRTLFPIYYSPLRLLPGPREIGWSVGNFPQLSTVDNTLLMQEWVQKFGPNCLIRWFFMIPSLWTVDPRTVNHILAHSTEYPKPIEARMHAARLVSESLLLVEGKVHKKQRRVLNPAFGPFQVREISQIFIEKAAQLRDLWTAQISAQGGCLRADVVDYLGRTTLDIMGLAGFNYNLQALNPQGAPNELNEAYRQIFAKPPEVSLLHVFRDLFPFLDIYPTERNRLLKQGREVARRIGMNLVQERKAAIIRIGGSNVEKKDVLGRDLLTLLIKANMSLDVPESQRLSDEEVLAQITSFLPAGHDTTSTALVWCLRALVKAPQVQQELHEELDTVASESPDVDEITALPYLECVIRETLRLYAPVTTTVRVAAKDDTLPVSEPFTDRKGKLQHEIRIAKGNRILLPISGMNESKLLWGDDALEFRPERWERPPEAISNVPGVWAHMLTFSGGPRACIGYRFAITEMKVIIFTLLRAFEFELAVPPSDVQPSGTFLRRPTLLSEPDKGAQLPLLIRPYVCVAEQSG